jgi:hypothetical protein
MALASSLSPSSYSAPSKRLCSGFHDGRCKSGDVASPRRAPRLGCLLLKRLLQATSAFSLPVSQQASQVVQSILSSECDRVHGSLRKQPSRGAPGQSDLPFGCERGTARQFSALHKGKMETMGNFVREQVSHRLDRCHSSCFTWSYNLGGPRRTRYCTWSGVKCFGSSGRLY